MSTTIACVLVAALVARTPEHLKTDVGDGLVRLAADLLKRGIEARSVQPPAEATLVLLVGASLRILAVVACCALTHLELETRSPRRLAAHLAYAGLAVYLYACPQALLAHVPAGATAAASAALDALATSASRTAMAAVGFLVAHGVPPPAPEVRRLAESVLGDERVRRALFAGGVTLVLGVSVIEPRDRALRALRLLVACWVLVTFDAKAARGAVCDALPTPPFLCDTIDALNVSYPVQMPYVWVVGALLVVDGVVARAFAV